MRRPSRRNLVIAALVGLSAGTALAQQSARDIEVLKRYAGQWAVDCTEAGGTRLQVDTRALALVAGSKQLRSGPPITAVSYFGPAIAPATPTGFEIALLGEVAPTGMVFIVIRDGADSYITVESDDSLVKRFGETALAGKFRRCD
jgi:hypothetical protein